MGEHDCIIGGEYVKKCYCQKCTQKYEEWCEEKKYEGEKHCKRICKTVCTIKCERPIKIVRTWGYKEDWEGKWEDHSGLPEPHECKRHEHKKHQKREKKQA
jgi:hypothetical protein